MHESNTIARAYVTAWESSDSAAFAALFSMDAIYRDDQAGRVSRGRDELHAFHRHFKSAIADFRLELSSVIGSGCQVCLEWISSGRHTGVYHGRRPTGNSFVVPGVAILTVTDVAISACTDYYDSRRLSQQLERGVTSR